MLERGYNTMRVGAQTDGWCDNGVFYLPCGPMALTDEWRENLLGMLDITARIPGLYVQLIPTFTHKGDDCGRRCLVDLTRTVVRIAQRHDYKHILWEGFNEFVHPSTAEGDNPSPWYSRGGNLDPAILRAVMDILPHPRGVDFPDNGKAGEDWRGNLKSSETQGAARLCDYIAFHPSRNPEPTAEAYRRTMALTGKPVIFDETVSYITMGEQAQVNKHHSNYTHGDTELEMKQQVRKQQQALCNAGSTCSFHALWLFSYDERIDWAPTCPCN
jgi:hypothetical protein